MSSPVALDNKCSVLFDRAFMEPRLNEAWGCVHSHHTLGHVCQMESLLHGLVIQQTTRQPLFHFRAGETPPCLSQIMNIDDKHLYSWLLRLDLSSTSPQHAKRCNFLIKTNMSTVSISICRNELKASPWLSLPAPLVGIGASFQNARTHCEHLFFLHLLGSPATFDISQGQDAIKKIGRLETFAECNRLWSLVPLPGDPRVTYGRVSSRGSGDGLRVVWADSHAPLWTLPKLLHYRSPTLYTHGFLLMVVKTMVEFSL